MSKRFRGLTCAWVLAGILAGCGTDSSDTTGGTGTSPPPAGGTPSNPETVTGVATPSNVSVVTATNAG